jgi:glycerate-2-kinase
MQLIKNFLELTKDSIQIRKDLLKILEYAMEKSLPEAAITKAVRLNNNELKITNEKLLLSETNNIFVIGSGKATYRMAIFKEIHRAD